MIGRLDLQRSALALDMINFATYIKMANAEAIQPLERGKAKQKRPDLRLVGPGRAVPPATVAALGRRTPMRAGCLTPCYRVDHHDREADRRATRNFGRHGAAS